MQVAVLENDKNRAVIEIHGSDHTVLLALKDALENDKEVELVTYAIDHPLVGHPKLILETKKKKPQEVLVQAITKVIKELESFGKDLDKKLK
ncbi:MAG: DNA-directed RNA polymerase subunit L [Candidatus Woesearchaeota archaeon]